MRAPQYHTLALQLQQQVTAVLVQQLRPRDFSRRCTAALLLGCLVLAAARRLSLAAVAAVRRACPSRETLRQALYATLPDYDALRREVPGLLKASLPRRLSRQLRPRRAAGGRPRRRRYPLVIDLHVVPFFKRGRTPPEHVRKGERLRGTRYGHAYATVSLLRKGQYFVLALTPYDPGEDLAALVRRLLQQAAALGFSPRYVLMDRTFWSADVFRYLQRARYPFLLPVLARGKKPTAPGGPTGTQFFVHAARSGRFEYRVANRQKQTAALTIVVSRRRRRAGQRRRPAWAYALWRVGLSTVRGVQQSYRRRFRIESSYRLLEAGRGRTSSRDEGLRLWYVVLAALLVNTWLQLRREGSRRWGPGEAGQGWFIHLLTVLAQALLDADAGGPRPQPTQTPSPKEVH